MSLPGLWPHQERLLEMVWREVDAGTPATLAVCPTGGGKTRVVAECLREAGRRGWAATLTTNRRLLIDQLARTLGGMGIDFGVRAAGWPEDLDKPVQLQSAATEFSRVGRAWRVHGEGRPGVDFWDEAHLQAGNEARTLMGEQRRQGHAVVGLTATPLDLEEVYDVLVQAGTNSELQECGALVLAKHYAPTRPDFRAYHEIQRGEDVSEEAGRKLLGEPAVLFGHVVEHYRRLNPDGRPAILFAPGVPESRWFAQELTRRGIPASHIDGDEVWFDGHFQEATADTRAELLARSRDGTDRVVCNRFVMREGVDAPWLSHGIFACLFSNLGTYLQAGGRLLRAAPGKGCCVIQDHGGNDLRHGSLNADREWRLPDTNRLVGAMRIDRLRDGRLAEPLVCPRCLRVLGGRFCPDCRAEVPRGRLVRPVLTAAGELVHCDERVFKPRYVAKRADTEALWKRMYYRAKNAGLTFRQAMGLFAQENRYWPPDDIPLMPRREYDFYRPVRDVPVAALTCVGDGKR